jgi:hypothetical protein
MSALSKRHNGVGASLSSPEDENISNFRDVVFLVSILDDGQSPEFNSVTSRHSLRWCLSRSYGGRSDLAW